MSTFAGHHYFGTHHPPALLEQLVCRPRPLAPTNPNQQAHLALLPSLLPLPPSQNEVGVVAWVMTLRTPECPQGRQVVAIVNDITHNSGES